MVFNFTAFFLIFEFHELAFVFLFLSIAYDVFKALKIWTELVPKEIWSWDLVWWMKGVGVPIFVLQLDQSSPGNLASHYSDQIMIKLDFLAVWVVLDFPRKCPKYLLSKPQLNSTQPNITLSWVRHENDFAYHPTTTPPPTTQTQS